MQPISDITVHGIDLKARGTTPSGLPLFRVVWGPSRLEKVLNKETGEMLTLRKYDSPGWVLEKWSDAQTYAGSREAFDEMVSSSNVAMEYPSDGEYEACYEFYQGQEIEDAHLIAKLMNFERERFTFADRRRAIKLKAEMEKKRVDKERDEIIDRAFESSPILDVTGRAYSLPN